MKLEELLNPDFTNSNTETLTSRIPKTKNWMFFFPTRPQQKQQHNNTIASQKSSPASVFHQQFSKYLARQQLEIFNTKLQSFTSKIHQQFIKQKKEEQKPKEKKFTIAESETELIGIDVIQNTFVSNPTLQRQANQTADVRVRGRTRRSIYLLIY